SAHRRDFDELLKIFRKQQMQIIPCFIDFKFFTEPKIVLPMVHPPDNQGEVLLRGVKQNGVREFVDNFYKNPINKPYRDDARTADWSRFIKGGRASVIAAPRECDNFIAKAFEPLVAA